MRAFEDEGIEFTFPTTTAYLARENKRPLHINLSDGFNFKDSDKD
jgi:small-conductance mechanosensitive channel